jgi:alpha-N-arabinofuranosidase
MNNIKLYLNPKRVVAKRNPLIYGLFVEHFHRQIYGGIFDPQNHLSDENGFRIDVINALKAIKPGVIRWPGGCFASDYRWKNAVGPVRVPYFDKAWRVEEPCTFGTDEFIRFCRIVGCEPYICTNAGSGSQNDISDWVEYCNLESEGFWAKQRIANGHEEPYKVKYWSIGNENYAPWEIGSKTPVEWGRFVCETAKQIKRVDPYVKIFAASVNDLDWNFELLKNAGQFIDYITVHGYWNKTKEVLDIHPYERCMAHISKVEHQIRFLQSIIETMGYSNRIKIAFDEWNLRGWHHPNMFFVPCSKEDYLPQRDKNDDNSVYTMADAVFTAGFLATCLQYCNVVEMANYAPAVNTRGLIYTYKDGIVLRSTYHVFDLFVNQLEEIVLQPLIEDNVTFKVLDGTETVEVDSIQYTASVDEQRRHISVAIINRDSKRELPVELIMENFVLPKQNAKVFLLSSNSPDDFNDVIHPDRVKIKQIEMEVSGNSVLYHACPHSVTVIKLSLV